MIRNLQKPNVAKAVVDHNATLQRTTSSKNINEADKIVGLQEQGGEALVSEAVRKAIANVDVKAAVSVLKEGTFLLKYCDNAFRKPHQRLFWVDMETLTLKWSSPKKRPANTQIFLTDVHRIVPGVDSDFWRGKSEFERRLGIELICHNRKLRFMCGQLEEWKTWLKGLLHAHQKAMAKRKRAGSLTNDFIRKQWALADLDNNGSLSFYELVHLLQRINCRADVRYAEQLFEQFDEDGSCVLEFDEFKLLFHKLLTHEDLMVYFDRYRDKRLHTVTEEGFRKFLMEVQGTPAHLVAEQVAAIETLEDPFRKDEGLTDLGFNLLLTSDFNSLISPARRSVNVHDMNHPLTYYWISTSHNTYLTGDQMIGKSAVGQYVEVLLKGCRCVELDCWDGSDGEPVIYHGHTLTSKIPFVAVVKACRDYGFKKSPYPVILSLEMHCSPKQKRRVGEILVKYLGDRIYRHPPGGPTPSPQELKGFFIIKGRIPNEMGEEIEEGNEIDLLLNEEELQLELLSEYPAGYSKSLPLSVINGSALALENPPNQNSSFDFNGDCEEQASNRVKIAISKDLNVSSSHSYAEMLKILLAEEYTTLVAIILSDMDICSLNEKRFLKLVKTKSQEISAFHQKYLSRVYPAGTRVMSSNFNPIPFWLQGCQMVALNFQALGLATLLNLGRFSENGGVGYVLKPPILRNRSEPFDPFSPTVTSLRAAQESPVELTVQVLAAQQLPRPSVDDKMNKRRDKVCPFIIVSVHGIKQDTKTWRTNYVLNNGLNPRWKDQKFTFDVLIPSLAVLVFEVRHYDAVRTDFLGGAATPVSAVRSGIRWVELYDSKLRPVHWSGLLVHATIKPSKKAMTSSLNESYKYPKDPSFPLGSALDSNGPDYRLKTLESMQLSHSNSAHLGRGPSLYNARSSAGAVKGRFPNPRELDINAARKKATMKGYDTLPKKNVAGIKTTLLNISAK